MPFAGFKDFNACVISQKQKHPSWSDERRKAFCGEIKARAEGTKQKHEGDSLLQKHFEELYVGMDALEIDLDALLKNQPIAKEGVLNYGPINKLKKWDNLKTFDTVILPIIDDHPIRENGNDGMWNEEHIYGYGTVKICPNEKKILCADLELDDDAPARQGYSIGYIYDPIIEKGENNGKDYDMIQDITELDHIALTNNPRDSYALRRTNNDSDNTDNVEINNKSVGYDHFKTFLNRSQSSDRKKPTNVNKMGKDDIIPDPTPAQNGTISVKEAELQRQIDALTQEKASDAKNKIENAKLQKELDAQKSSNLLMKKQLDASVSKNIKTYIDSAKTEFNIDGKFFDKKGAKYIEGALDFARYLKANDSLKPGETKPPVKDGEEQTEGDAVGFDHRNYEWDAKLEKMVDPITRKPMEECYDGN